MIMRNGPSPLASGNAATHNSRVSDDLLWEPEKQTAIARPTFQNVLLETGAVTAETLTQANTVLSKTPGRALHQVLIEVGADETAVYQALAKVHDLPFEHPTPDSIQEDVFTAVGSEFARQQGAIGLRRDDHNRFMIGLTDPANVFLLDELRRKVRREVVAVVVTPSSIARLCEAMAGDKNADDAAAIDSIISEVADDDVSVVDDKQADVEDLEKAGQESPVIRFVNYLIADAIKQGASDIHIEPKEKALQIRYRIDGVLFSSMNPPYSMAPAITSRLKIMGNLDIAERRLPQDGRIRAVVQGRKIDLRMSTLPTANGEKTVIRVLDNRSINVPLEALGFSENALTIWQHQIDQP